MARGTLATLIGRIRLLIADTSGTPLLTDDQVQDKLDECRTDVWQHLTPCITFGQPGEISYNDYYFMPDGRKPVGMWEANEVILNGIYATITPLTSDELVGHWTFNNQLPPVFVRGRYFDIYRAAADLLDYKIANLAASAITFTSDGQQFQLGQQIQTLQAMRDDYRRKQRAVSHQTRRADVEGGESLGTAPEQAHLAGPVSANVPFLTGE